MKKPVSQNSNRAPGNKPVEAISREPEIDSQAGEKRYHDDLHKNVIFADYKSPSDCLPFKKYAEFYNLRDHNKAQPDSVTSGIQHLYNRYHHWIEDAKKQSTEIQFQDIAKCDNFLWLEICSEFQKLGIPVLPTLHKLVDACTKIKNKYGKLSLKTIGLGTESNNSTNWSELKALLTKDEKDEFETARQIAIDEMFEHVSKLPLGEIERQNAVLSKKVANWPDHFPKLAPEYYNDRKASEKFPDFMLRVYGSKGYLDGTFTTAHLQILDDPAAIAARGWLRTHHQFPEELNLPVSQTRQKSSKPTKNNPMKSKP